MTVVQPNSIAGINSISVQSGQSLSIHKSDGTLIREIVASTGISTYSSISVGSATTTNNANKSINIGLGASIAQHADNTLSFGTNGDERVRIDATGQFNIGVAATIFANGNATFAGIVTTARLGNTYVTSQLGIGGAAADYQNLHIHDADPRIRIQSSGTNAAKIQFADSGSGDVGVIEYSHSDNSMRFNTNSGERVRIDSSGRVLVGTSAGRSAAGVTAQLQVEGTSYDTASLNLIINANSNQPPYLSLAKTRGTSDGSSTIVQANDYLGIIQFCGADGTDIESRGAEIYAQVDGSPGSNDMPGRLVFKTTADGAASPSERLRIDSSGRVIITNDSVTHSTGTNTQYAPLVVRGNTSATSSRAAFINFARSEASANIAADEGIGEIYFGDQQAGEYGAIKCTADGTAAVGDYPGRLTFHTTADGGTTMSERLRISSTGLMTQTGQTRISQSSTHSHGLNAGTVLEIRGDAIGDGVVDVDYFKGLKLALNNATEWGGQAQFAVGRWQDDGNKAKTSFVLSLSNGQIDSSTNADQDIFTCHSNGRMYVGHTSNNAGSNGRFYVQSAGSSECTCDLHHSSNDNSNVLNVIHGGVGVNGNPTRVMVEWRNFANTAIATIQSNSTTITYGTGSDYRMKENQVDISDGITRVKQLKPYRFNWKSEYGGGDKVDGFFAHEAATVVPEAVQGTKDAVDSDGNIIRQQIDPSKLVPLLTAALQEAITKIETLETKVAALESS